VSHENHASYSGWKGTSSQVALRPRFQLFPPSRHRCYYPPRRVRVRTASEFGARWCRSGADLCPAAQSLCGWVSGEVARGEPSAEQL